MASLTTAVRLLASRVAALSNRVRSCLSIRIGTGMVFVLLGRITPTS